MTASALKDKYLSKYKANVGAYSDLIKTRQIEGRRDNAEARHVWIIPHLDIMSFGRLMPDFL
ncbi:MAG: hypothetical protein HC850_03520 [Rhodomicrobium sp.]|nr:hypothetical protein [Rhodomicrobium sp.]